MRAHSRRFLLLILMVALPVQAWAAATMFGCAFGERELASALVAMDEMAHAEPHAMDHPRMDHSDMDHAGDPMAQTDEPEACHSSREHLPLNGDAHECQHCAACLIGAALPMQVEPLPIGLAITQRYVLLPDAAPVAFFPDGPERPPRNPLA